ARQGALEERQGPASLIDPLRDERLRGLEPVALLGGEGLEGQDGAGAPSLLAAGARPLVDEEPLEAGEEERAEPPAGGIGRLQEAALEEPGDEFLGQVARLLGAVPLPPDERIEGIPVSGEEAGQG